MRECGGVRGAIALDGDEMKNSLGISLGLGRPVATVYDRLKPREIPKEFNNPTRGTLLELGE